MEPGHSFEDLDPSVKEQLELKTFQVSNQELFAYIILSQLCLPGEIRRQRLHWNCI